MSENSQAAPLCVYIESYDLRYAAHSRGWLLHTWMCIECAQPHTAQSTAHTIVSENSQAAPLCVYIESDELKYAAHSRRWLLHTWICI